MFLFCQKQVLKSKLQSKNAKKYQGVIEFTHSGNKEATGKFQSCLIYNKTIRLVCAVTQAYQPGQSDVIKDVCLFLRESVLNAFGNSQELLWPLLPSRFQNAGDYIPEDLKKLLSFVMFG